MTSGDDSSQPKNQLFVYHYQFLDDLSFVRQPPAFPLFGDLKTDRLDQLVSSVRDQFAAAGWEGDGEIGVIWLPPFVGTGLEDTWGTYVWHVKQSNNGMSWIASDSPLNFKHLSEQNERHWWDTHIPASIVYTDCLGLKNITESRMDDLVHRIQFLARSVDPIAAEITEELLVVAQGELVSQLNEFLHDCYLRVLEEVLNNGNRSRLALGKFKAKLDPARYIPECQATETDAGDASEWFTIQGLIRDIWMSYKFEPFSNKMAMLFNACEYKIEHALKSELVKHVQLRNCIQHHEREVTDESLKMAGAKNFSVIANDGTTQQLVAGQRICFSDREVTSFARRLVELAASVDAHVLKRIGATTWVPRELGKNTQP